MPRTSNHLSHNVAMADAVKLVPRKARRLDQSANSEAFEAAVRPPTGNHLAQLFIATGIVPEKAPTLNP